MSEVFRFMLARAPERAAEDSLVPLTTGSGFQEELARARGEADPRGRMRAVAQGFLADPHLASEKEWSAWIPDYVKLHALARCLQEIVEPAEESKGEPEGILIAKVFLDVFGLELDKYLASPSFATGWERVADTLVALKIVSGAPGGLVEDFSTLARLYALLRRSVPPAEVPPARVADALAASLVLPEAAVMIGLPVSAEPTSRTVPGSGEGDPAETSGGVDGPSLALEPSAGTRVTRIGAHFWEGWDQSASPAADKSLEALPRTIGSLQPVGVGDLLIVKHRVVGYEGGEVAHVENVLKSEMRERQHRALKRTEETITIGTETTRTDERDLQSTERFDLKSEASSVIKEDHKLDAGLEVSGKYGVVNFKAHANYKFEHSKEEATKRASSYSKEVTQRASSKVVERVRQERQTKTLTETEEKNVHGFDNKAGTGHISGVYQWVDRIMEAQVFDYGKRLLFDAVVPEPAAFLLDALETRKPEGEDLVKPEEFILGPDEIDENNYRRYVAQYRVPDAVAPPVQYKRKAETHSGATDQPADLVHHAPVQIEDGYVGKDATVTAIYTAKEGKPGSLIVALGRNFRIFLTTDVQETFDLRTTGQYHFHPTPAPGVFLPPPPRDPEVPNPLPPDAHPAGAIPLTIQAMDIRSYTVSIDIKLERSERAMKNWQLETHAKILKGYLALRSAYYEKLAALMFEQTVGGRNPDQNRLLERTELKKAAVMLLTGQRFDGFGAIEENQQGLKYPRAILAQAALQGPYVRFFEQAFEWDQMTYVFYPYFWGRQGTWYQRAVLSDPDLVFAEFLRAGAARVVFPVRPGFEAAILHYLEVGEIWDGGPLPDVSSPLYVHIVEELKARAKAPGVETPYTKPWKFRLPTSLVKLRADDALPVLTRDWEPA